MGAVAAYAIRERPASNPRDRERDRFRLGTNSRRARSYPVHDPFHHLRHRRARRMDFNLTLEQEAFRDELRVWFAENIPPEWKNPATRPVSGSPEEEALYRAWARKVAQAGYTRLYWPKEYGG